MNGNSYIDSNENPSYYQSHQSGVTKQRVVEAKEKLKADTEAWGTLIDAFKANKVTEYSSPCDEYAVSISNDWHEK